jgi:hypothetical protein
MQGLEELRSSGRRLNKVPASLRQAHLMQEVWAFAHPSDQTRRIWFAILAVLWLRRFLGLALLTIGSATTN